MKSERALIATATIAVAAVATAYLASVSDRGWVGRPVSTPSTASAEVAPSTQTSGPFQNPTDDEAYGPVLIGGETDDGYTWNLRYSTTAHGVRVCLEDHAGGYEGAVACYNAEVGQDTDPCGHPGEWAVGFGGLWEPRKGILWGSAFSDVGAVKVALDDGSAVPAHFGFAPEGADLRLFVAVVPTGNAPVRVLGESAKRDYVAMLRPSNNAITRHEIFEDPSAGGGLAFRPPFGNCGG